MIPHRAGPPHRFATGLESHVRQIYTAPAFTYHQHTSRAPDRPRFLPASSLKIPEALQRDSAKIKELSAFEHIVSPETFASQRRPGPHTYGSRPAARAVHHHVCCTFRSLTGLSHLAVAINNPGQVPQSTSCLSVCVVTCLNPY